MLEVMRRQDKRLITGEGAPWKGALAGLIGGLAASWVMNRLHEPLANASEIVVASTTGRRWEPPPPNGEDATIKTAEAIAQTFLDRRLTKEARATAGPIVHYAFGSGVGAAYGALAELAPHATAVWGLPFGAALWFGADEVAVPALGLSGPPREYPPAIHLSALAAHLVYGFTTDAVRRLLRLAL